MNVRKPNHAFFIFLGCVAIYIGYCLGMLQGQNVSLDNAAEVISAALLNPLPFRKTELTGKAILICLLIWAIAYLHHISTVRNYMPGKEYGSARIAFPEEICRKLFDRTGLSKNKILSEHLSIGLNISNMNNNLLVIGGSGAGKSFYIVKPNAYNCESSYVFTDPKGELLRDCGNYLKMKGYHIVVLNLIDIDFSDHYNPFAYIRTDEDIIKLITNLIANTTPKGSIPSDPFWEKAEGMYLQSIMLYVWYEFPKHGRIPNFAGVLELLNKAKIPEDENELSDLDVLMYALPDNHPALLTYKKVRSGAADTVRSIIISANSRLAYLQNPKVMRILSRDDMNIAWAGEGVYENPDRKTAIFCVIPDNDKSYNFIVGMLYTQMFQELYFVADHKYKGQLPVPVAFWFDEFANVALPEDFCTVLATMRSRLISANIIIQNLAQLKALFKDSWESVTGNCDTTIYLGGNEQSTHKYISELLGKWTIDKRSSGETLGSHGSSSRNYDVLGRELLTPDEVRKMDNKKCLIFIKGQDPVMDDKYHTFKRQEFKDASKLGPYLSVKELDELYEMGRLNFYIDAVGENAMEKSLQYQVENYLGVFQESKVYHKGREIKEDCMIIDTETSYYYDGMEVMPVYAKDVQERIYSGGNILIRHPVIGYYVRAEFGQEKEVVKMENEQLRAIFTENNRITSMVEVA